MSSSSLNLLLASEMASPKPTSSGTELPVNTPPESVVEAPPPAATIKVVVEPAVDNVVETATQNITSHLSNAISEILVASFDDAAKNLVSRVSETKETLDEDGGRPEPDPESEPAPEAPPAEPEEEIPLPTYEVPYARNPYFVGRAAALGQLFGKWKPGEKGRIAVSGLGGIGKTELAVEFVHRVKLISPVTETFWFGVNDLRIDDPSSDYMPVEKWLDTTSSGPDTILVVDTGDNFGTLVVDRVKTGRLVDLLKNFPGTVILVARSTQNGRELVAPHNIIEINELEFVATKGLLRDNLESGARSTVSEHELSEAANLMICHPRAILQAAHLINSTGMKVSQFLDLYHKGDDFKIRLFGRLDPVSRPDYSISVIGKGVFDVGGFRRIYYNFSRFLYQLYFLGGAAVPRSIFSAADPLDMLLTMFIVKGHHLVIDDDATQTYTIHPLVYLAMRNTLENERSMDQANAGEERVWYEDTVLAFSSQYPDASHDSRAWWKECFANLVAGYELPSDSLRSAVATIYHRESSFFKRKGMFAESLKMIVLGKNVLPKPIPQSQLVILQDQVTLLQLLAKYRDMHKVLQSFMVEKGQPGMVWKQRMQAKLEQADCANRYDSALETFRHILVTREATNALPAEISLARDDLGQVLMFKGRYGAAASECRRALNARKASFGSTYPDTLDSYHNLAEISSREGKYAEAVQYAQSAIMGRENLLGPDHPETVHSKAVKASILIAKAASLTELDEAEALLSTCIDRLITRLSSTHPLVLSCKSELALILQYRGQYEEAEHLNHCALVLREQGPWLEPTSHPNTLTSKHQLCATVFLSSGPKAADQKSEDVLNARTSVLTSRSNEDFHPDQLESLHLRAIILSALHQHTSALQKIEQALSGRKAVLGGEHPDYFMSMSAKGEILRAQSPRERNVAERASTLDLIESLHKAALENLTFILGPSHLNTLQTLTHLALLKQERGTPGSRVEAEDLFRQAHRQYQRAHGDLHPETLKAKGRWADAMRLSSANNHAEAKRLWREACAGFAKVYGFDAYLTTEAYKSYERFLKTWSEAKDV